MLLINKREIKTKAAPKRKPLCISPKPTIATLGCSTKTRPGSKLLLVGFAGLLKLPEPARWMFYKK
jgi:hypothetical protein